MNRLLRYILKSITDGMKIKKRLPNGIYIYVSPGSQLKYLKNSFDIDLATVADEFITDRSIVWDVGANCGVFSFLCSRAANRTAIEPDPTMANLINESIALNGCQIEVIEAAAFNKSSQMELTIARRGRAANYLTIAGGNNAAGGQRDRIQVRTIDVEGSELQVLEGANEILTIFRPMIYLETNPKTQEDCIKLLKSKGYFLSKRSEMDWLAVHPH